MRSRYISTIGGVLPVAIIFIVCEFLSFTVVASYINPRSTPIWNNTWTDRLKRDLLLKYDKYARPAQHYDITQVKFDLNFNHVSIDEFKSAVTIHAWTRITWQDDKLKWNSSNYGGLSSIQVGNHEVWQPDIVLYNSAIPNSIEYYGDTHCLIFENGEVLWVPPSQFIALCELDFRFWPFDTHVCSLNFGSWTFHGEHVDLDFYEYKREYTEVTHEPQISNRYAEWKILNVTRDRISKRYPCCKESYVTLYINVTLQRSSSLYYSTVMTPATAIVFLTLIMFWLPPYSETKFVISGFTAIIIVIFLVYFSYRIPFTDSSPLIVYFYSGCLCQVIFSLIISAIVINLSKRPYCEPLPRRVRCLLLGWPGKLLGLWDMISLIRSRRPITGQELRGNITDEATNVISVSNEYEDGDRQNMIMPAKNTTQLEWILAATAIDRIGFLLFCFILSIMGIVWMH